MAMRKRPVREAGKKESAPKPLNVLVVDDSTVMRRIVERILREAGFKIGRLLEASDGYEALAAIKSSPDLDLILCDYHIRAMDGLAVAREVRRMPKIGKVPFLIISTEGCLDTIKAARGAGVDGFLTKPFSPEELQNAILRILKR